MLSAMQASSQSSGWPPLPGILLEPKAHVQCGDFDKMVLLQVHNIQQSMCGCIAVIIVLQAKPMCIPLHTLRL